MTPHIPAVIEAMLRADFYPHDTQDIRLLQTHISWVILTGKYAYKVKKPVDFGFLDFSSLDRRKHFCAEELRLNRRLAPHLYLAALPIGKLGGCFQLDGKQGISEWCIKMRQFDDGNLLVERMQTGDFDARWIDILAKDIAGFHLGAECSKAITTYGAPHFLLRHIDASLNTALHHPEVIDPVLIHDLRRQCMELAKEFAPVFDARMRDKHIRDCHGDLHLGNIALFEDRPTVFDCIEFSPEYRAIDTLSDAAFLVMDLDARGHADLAFRFLSRYLEFSGDYSGMALLPLLLSYRAGVRGKVACLLAEDASIGQNEAQRKLHEAEDYFAQAADYLNRPPSPRLYAIGGLSGSGKSRLALKGCGIERAIIIRSDATRKRIAASHPDLALYGDAMNRHTYDAMYDAASTLLAAGWSVILDATFLSGAERNMASKLAQSSGVAYLLYWLDIPEEQLREHIRHRQTDDINISDADLNVLEHQLASFQRPDEPGVLFLPSTDAWPQA